jgi:hypothetical protein
MAEFRYHQNHFDVNALKQQIKRTSKMHTF